MIEKVGISQIQEEHCEEEVKETSFHLLVRGQEKALLKMGWGSRSAESQKVAVSTQGGCQAGPLAKQSP